MNYRFVLLLLFSCFFLDASSASAALLGKVRGGTFGTVIFRDLFPKDVAHATMTLGYREIDDQGFIVQEGITADVVPQAGPFPFTQTFDSESEGFDRLVERLTNGVDEQIWGTYTLTNTDGTRGFPGGGSGADESFRFGGSRDLIGNRIDAIELEVTRFLYFPGGRIDLRAEWRILGVPEPASLGMTFVLVLWVGTNCRRR